MSEVETVNGVAPADIETINGVAADDIETINGVDFVTVTPFNEYALKQTESSPVGYVSILGPSDYHFVDGTTDQPFSLSVWFKTSTTGMFPFLTKGNVQYSNGSVTPADLEWFFGIYTSSKILWRLYANDSGSQWISQYSGLDLGLNDGNWHHIVATYNANTRANGMFVYVDGSVLAQANNEGGEYGDEYMNNSGQAVLIGKWDGNSNVMIGYIDEVSVWEKALSSSEVSAIYNSGVPTDLSEHSAASDLVSWWRMGDNDGGTGTTLTDAAPDRGVGERGPNNGTLNSFAVGDGFSSDSVP